MKIKNSIIAFNIWLICSTVIAGPGPQPAVNPATTAKAPQKTPATTASTAGTEADVDTATSGFASLSQNPVATGIGGVVIGGSTAVAISKALNKNKNKQLKDSQDRIGILTSEKDTAQTRVNALGLEKIEKQAEIDKLRRENAKGELELLEVQKSSAKDKRQITELAEQNDQKTARIEELIRESAKDTVAAERLLKEGDTQLSQGKARESYQRDLIREYNDDHNKSIEGSLDDITTMSEKIETQQEEMKKYIDDFDKVQEFMKKNKIEIDNFDTELGEILSDLEKRAEQNRLEYKNVFGLSAKREYLEKFRETQLAINKEYTQIIEQKGRQQHAFKMVTSFMDVLKEPDFQKYAENFAKISDYEKERDIYIDQIRKVGVSEGLIEAAYKKHKFLVDKKLVERNELVKKLIADYQDGLPSEELAAKIKERLVKKENRGNRGDLNEVDILSESVSNIENVYVGAVNKQNDLNSSRRQADRPVPDHPVTEPVATAHEPKQQETRAEEERAPNTGFASTKKEKKAVHFADPERRQGKAKRQTDSQSRPIVERVVQGHE